MPPHATVQQLEQLGLLPFPSCGALRIGGHWGAGFDPTGYQTKLFSDICSHPS